MKTAISIPDDLFRSADSVAKKLGMSRSGLYAAAVAEYVAKYRARGLTERLNAVYADEGSQLDPSLRALQTQSLEHEEW
jgi:metal-responsive CopG/Arc/MetJ family transcriptional regulator